MPTRASPADDDRVPCSLQVGAKVQGACAHRIRQLRETPVPDASALSICVRRAAARGRTLVSR
jgi:hypothetical protein